MEGRDGKEKKRVVCIVRIFLGLDGIMDFFFQFWWFLGRCWDDDRIAANQ